MEKDTSFFRSIFGASGRTGYGAIHETTHCIQASSPSGTKNDIMRRIERLLEKTDLSPTEATLDVLQTLAPNETISDLPEDDKATLRGYLGDENIKRDTGYSDDVLKEIYEALKPSTQPPALPPDVVLRSPSELKAFKRPPEPDVPRHP